MRISKIVIAGIFCLLATVHQSSVAGDRSANASPQVLQPINIVAPRPSDPLYTILITTFATTIVTKLAEKAYKSWTGESQAEEEKALIEKEKGRLDIIRANLALRLQALKVIKAEKEAGISPKNSIFQNEKSNEDENASKSLEALLNTAVREETAKGSLPIRVS